MTIDNNKNLLGDLSVEDSLEKNVLRRLGTHISIRRLVGDEDTSEFTLGSIDLVDCELDIALEHVELLVVLLEQLVLLRAGLSGSQGTSEVVAGGGTTALGVKEQTRAVGGHSEGSAQVEARLDGAGGGRLGDQILDGEQKGHTGATGGLHGGGGVVDAVLLGEDSLAVLDLEGAGHLVQGVGLASHQLGVHELQHGRAVLHSNLSLNLHIQNTMKNNLSR